MNYKINYFLFKYYFYTRKNAKSIVSGAGLTGFSNTEEDDHQMSIANFAG